MKRVCSGWLGDAFWSALLLRLMGSEVCSRLLGQIYLVLSMGVVRVVESACGVFGEVLLCNDKNFKIETLSNSYITIPLSCGCWRFSRWHSRRLQLFFWPETLLISLVLRGSWNFIVVIVFEGHWRCQLGPAEHGEVCGNFFYVEVHGVYGRVLVSVLLADVCVDSGYLALAGRRW